MVAERDLFERLPVCRSVVEDGILDRWGGARLLFEIVRRSMWEEGEI